MKMNTITEGSRVQFRFLGKRETGTITKVYKNRTVAVELDSGIGTLQLVETCEQVDPSCGGRIKLDPMA
jgi:hypothetical protein